MKIVSRLRLPANRLYLTVASPDLTDKQLVPSYVSVYEVVSGTEVPATEISCKISAGGVDIYNCTEAYFKVSNEFDLKSAMLHVERTGRIEAVLMNRSRDVKNIVLHIEYTHSLGTIIYQDKCDTFDDVLQRVHASGRCTKLILSFNRAVDEIQCATTAECPDSPDDWISSFNVVTNPEEGDNAVYAVDCVGEAFSRYFDYLQLRVSDSASEEVRMKTPLSLYILAYGFPKK